MIVSFLTLAAALSPSSHAQMIARAEQGAVTFVYDPFTRTGETVVVRRGETAWRETARPSDVKRLLDDAPQRIRPNQTDAVPAGSLLFGYRLSTGSAYCAAIDTSKPNGDVQCFRDLDNDGTFDAGYVTATQHRKDRYFSPFIQGLAPTPKLRYEAAASDGMEPAAWEMVYVGMRNGAPRFEQRVDGRSLAGKLDCQVRSPGVCDVWGVRLGFVPATGGAVQLTFIATARQRTTGLTSQDQTLLDF